MNLHKGVEVESISKLFYWEIGSCAWGQFRGHSFWTRILFACFL